MRSRRPLWDDYPCRRAHTASDGLAHRAPPIPDTNALAASVFPATSVLAIGTRTETTATSSMIPGSWYLGRFPVLVELVVGHGYVHTRPPGAWAPYQRHCMLCSSSAPILVALHMGHRFLWMPSINTFTMTPPPSGECFVHSYHLHQAYCLGHNLWSLWFILLPFLLILMCFVGNVSFLPSSPLVPPSLFLWPCSLPPEVLQMYCM